MLFKRNKLWQTIPTVQWPAFPHLFDTCYCKGLRVYILNELCKLKNIQFSVFLNFLVLIKCKVIKKWLFLIKYYYNPQILKVKINNLHEVRQVLCMRTGWEHWAWTKAEIQSNESYKHGEIGLFRVFQNSLGIELVNIDGGTCYETLDALKEKWTVRWKPTCPEV